MFETLRNSGWTGVALLIGAAVVAPAVLPSAGRAARPAAKSALKASLLAYERAREHIDELVEAGDDLLAEVRSEIEAERRRRAEETDAPPGAGDTASDAP